MNITLSKATQEDKSTIQNLGLFYVYELSKYCGFFPNWETSPNGLFECIDLSSYCEKPDGYAFLVKVDDELAGFVLINKVGSLPEVLKWVINEAKKAKCDQVHLDSGLQRHDAHRLYLNYGFKIIGHHFSLDLKENV